MPMYRHLYDWFRHAITLNHLYTAAIVIFASLCFSLAPYRDSRLFKW